jgi:hypothetical protein
MAAAQVCFQLWLASSLMADSLAVACQTMLAKSLAAKDTSTATGVSGSRGAEQTDRQEQCAAGLVLCISCMVCPTQQCTYVTGHMLQATRTMEQTSALQLS